MLKIAKDIRKFHAKSIVICDHKKEKFVNIVMKQL